MVRQPCSLAFARISCSHRPAARPASTGAAHPGNHTAWYPLSWTPPAKTCTCWVTPVTIRTASVK